MTELDKAIRKALLNEPGDLIRLAQNLAEEVEVLRMVDEAALAHVRSAIDNSDPERRTWGSLVGTLIGAHPELTS